MLPLRAIWDLHPNAIRCEAGVPRSAFGLRYQPFTKEIDDADLWLPESKAALVADIEEALAER